MLIGCLRLFEALIFSQKRSKEHNLHNFCTNFKATAPNGQYEEGEEKVAHQQKKKGWKLLTLKEEEQ